MMRESAGQPPALFSGCLLGHRDRNSLVFDSVLSAAA